MLVAAARHRRQREHLGRIAARVSMNLADGPAPAALLEKASQYHGRACKAKLGDLLIGHGESRAAFLARRKVGRSRHQVLFFELSSSSRLDGFYDG